MKINFTKKEYRLLLDLAYLGQWFIDAHKPGGPNENDGYEMLTQKIYSFSKEMGCEAFINSDKVLNKFFVSRLYEEESGIHDIIDQYNEDTFWDELVDRLAERDTHAEAKTSNQKISSMEDYWKLCPPHESRYVNEFSENGIENLILKETK